MRSHVPSPPDVGHGGGWLVKRRVSAEAAVEPAAAALWLASGRRFAPWTSAACAFAGGVTVIAAWRAECRTALSAGNNRAAAWGLPFRGSRRRSRRGLKTGDNPFFYNRRAGPITDRERTMPPGLRVVLLGTGTPNAEPDRSGPAAAVVKEDRIYLVDCGPGVVRRAVAAGLDATLLNTALLTHLHSDHTAGNLELKEKTGCRVAGAKKDEARIPGIDLKLEEGDHFSFGELDDPAHEAASDTGHGTANHLRCGALVDHADKRSTNFRYQSGQGIHRIAIKDVADQINTVIGFITHNV